MFAISNDELAQLPRVKPGHRFRCEECGKRHTLRAADDGSTMLLAYRCKRRLMLGAIDGRFLGRGDLEVVGVKNDTL